MAKKQLDVEEVEAKVRAAMKFIGRSEQTVWVCGHRYDFGAMKRQNNQVEYNAKSGRIKLSGNDSWRARGTRRSVSKVLSKNSQHRAEALRAIFNSIIPEVRRVGQQKMEWERLNSYLRSKKVPLSI